jgi:hypothetical protein
MKIKVMQKHIAHGERKSPASCPIALAIREQAPEVAPNAKVSRAFVRTRNRNYPLSRRAERFVKQFDEGKTVTPFTFELNLWTK